MNRYLKDFVLFFVCIAIVFTGLTVTGCAPAPKTYVTEVTDGETLPGESVGYIYQLKRKGNSYTYVLGKKKYCYEEIEKIAHERKRSQDVSGAATTVLLPLGIVFPRVGQPLLDTGFEKSRGENEEAIGSEKTGRIMPCGDYIPASGENIVVMTSDSKVIENIQSNKNGVIDLTGIASTEKSAVYLNVFIQQRGSAYFVATAYIN